MTRPREPHRPPDRGGPRIRGAISSGRDNPLDGPGGHAPTGGRWPWFVVGALLLIAVMVAVMVAVWSVSGLQPQNRRSVVEMPPIQTPDHGR